MRRIALTLAAAAAVTVLGSTPALAHECIISSRSAQGDLAATHSANWFIGTVADFAHSPGFPPGYDPDCFVEHWLAAGGPESFTIRSDKTIGENSANPNLGNGKGLDHIEDAYGGLLGASLGACAL